MDACLIRPFSAYSLKISIRSKRRACSSRELEHVTASTSRSRALRTSDSVGEVVVGGVLSLSSLSEDRGRGRFRSVFRRCTPAENEGVGLPCIGSDEKARFVACRGPRGRLI